MWGAGSVCPVCGLDCQCVATAPVALYPQVYVCVDCHGWAVEEDKVLRESFNVKWLVDTLKILEKSAFMTRLPTPAESLAGALQHGVDQNRGAWERQAAALLADLPTDIDQGNIGDVVRLLQSVDSTCLSNAGRGSQNGLLCELGRQMKERAA